MEYFFQKRRKKILRSKWRSRPHSRHNKFRGPQYPKIGNIEEYKLPPPVVDPIIRRPKSVQVATLHKVKKETKSTRDSIPYPSYSLYGLLNVNEAVEHFPKSLEIYHPALGEVIFQVMYSMPFSSHAYDAIKIRLKSNNPDTQYEYEITNDLLGHIYKKEDWEQVIRELLIKKTKNLLNITYGAY